VQVDRRLTPYLPPGFMASKLKHFKLLSSFAFKLNLRRYIQAQQHMLMQAQQQQSMLLAGAYTRPLLSSSSAVSDTKYTLNTP